MLVRQLVSCCTLAFASFGLAHAAESLTILGAGSSAAAPVYRAWAANFTKSSGIALDYRSIGSGAGLKAIREKKADFGASDVAPSKEDLDRDGLILVPTFITGAVPVVNVPRFHGHLRLTGDVLARIFSGEIVRWNDKAIQSLNPQAELPDFPIVPIVRSDGSGTTYYFTQYLSHVSEDWKTKHGSGATVTWFDHAVGAKGTDGVVAAVKSTEGSIGYVDFNYVGEHHLNDVILKNGHGEWITAGPEGFRASLQDSTWSKTGDFHGPLVDLPAHNAWPITMGTFIVVHKVADDSARASNVVRFFVWALQRGDATVDAMQFVRLPDKIQASAYGSLSKVVDQTQTPIGINALSNTVSTN